MNEHQIDPVATEGNEEEERREIAVVKFYNDGKITAFLDSSGRSVNTSEIFATTEENETPNGETEKNEENAKQPFCSFAVYILNDGRVILSYDTKLTEIKNLNDFIQGCGCDSH